MEKYETNRIVSYSKIIINKIPVDLISYKKYSEYFDDLGKVLKANVIDIQTNLSLVGKNDVRFYYADETAKILGHKGFSATVIKEDKNNLGELYLEFENVKWL